MLKLNARLSFAGAVTSLPLLGAPATRRAIKNTRLNFSGAVRSLTYLAPASRHVTAKHLNFLFG
jgi:hypothetical protein